MDMCVVTAQHEQFSVHLAMRMSEDTNAQQLIPSHQACFEKDMAICRRIAGMAAPCWCSTPSKSDLQDDLVQLSSA